MSIIPSPTLRRHHRKADGDVIRRGPAAVFDWGAPLPQKTMQEIAAMEPAAWETAVAPLPTADPIALIEHAWRMAVAPLETLLHDPLPDTDWANALAGTEASTVRMCSRAVETCQRILAGAEETGTEAAR